MSSELDILNISLTSNLQFNLIDLLWSIWCIRSDISISKMLFNHDVIVVVLFHRMFSEITSFADFFNTTYDLIWFSFCV